MLFRSVGNPIDPKAICTRKIPSTADIENITDALYNEMRRCAANYKRTKTEENV